MYKRQGLGGFSGAFSLAKIKEMEEPVLLSGTDGCGTKVKLAIIKMCIRDRNQDGHRLP